MTERRDSMQIIHRAGSLVREHSDAAIVPVAGSADVERLGGLADDLDGNLRHELVALAQDAQFTGRIGTAYAVATLGAVPARRLILAGIGDGPALSEDAIVRGFAAAAQTAREAGAVRLVAASPPPLAGNAGSALAAAVVGVRLGFYRFAKYRGTGQTNGDAGTLQSLAFIGTDREAAAIGRGETIANAVCLARDLVNEPAAILTPAEFARRAVALAHQSGLAVEVLGPDELAAIGARAILAVGGGSDNPPRLIRLRYRPAGASQAETNRIVGLVGKTITFDSGGYSIKPYEGMLEMKGDMAGGAAVLATMSALRALDCPVTVDGTICAAENMISGRAFRPGDILTGMNGVTMEILSTDAEGRLVLADGLVDAARRGATELIDLATLTGAIKVALGEGATGLFASDDRLADGLLAAAHASGERFWRMPLFEELNEKIKGDVGDVKNSGGRDGGAITAALFLQRFTEGLPWAHLDIAAAARFDRKNVLGPKGGSGVPVRTLLHYLLDPSD